MQPTQSSSTRPPVWVPAALTAAGLALLNLDLAYVIALAAGFRGFQIGVAQVVLAACAGIFLLVLAIVQWKAFLAGARARVENERQTL